MRSLAKSMPPNDLVRHAQRAEEIGNVAPKGEIVEKFRKAGGEGKPTYGQLTVCWG